jgi:Sulfotransferase domain
MLDVIGAGFGRTGTVSMKKALETLGFGPCHHMLDLFERPSEIELWREAERRQTADWEKLYAGHRSTIDWPGSRFWRDLVARYPEAKVILTVRDPQSWYVSARDSIYASMLPPDNGSDPVFTKMREMSDEVVWQGVFKGRFADMEYALNVYEEHNEAVRREVPADRLLVFEVGEGWQPLCDFLGVPVPAEPFPRLNNRATFARLIDDHTGPVTG